MSALSIAPAPPVDLLIRSARVVDPRSDLDGPADVLVRSGRIAEVGAAGALPTPDGGEAIDAAGRHLFPAFVDPHVHLRVPGQEHKEDIATGTAAAAAGGFCTVIAMPNTEPPVCEASILRSLRESAAREARVRVGFLAGITRGLEGEQLTEMAELCDAGALGFSDDGLPVADAGVLRRAFQYQRLCGGVLALHEEDPALSAGGSMHEGEVSALLGVAGIPSISESTMISRDAAIAGYESGRMHALHLSCVESVEAVAAAKAAEFAVTAEVCPHHLVLTDADVRSLDTRRKMHPPLRAELDRHALIEALRAGTIDCVATDHAPHAAEEKEVPFEQAPMGTTGLETAFAALHTELVVPGSLPLDVLVERMTAGGAIYGLEPPRIEPGAPADLALVDLDAEWVAGAQGYASRSSNCCFDGARLRGRVLLTLAAGRVAHEDPAAGVAGTRAGRGLEAPA